MILWRTRHRLCESMRGTELLRLFGPAQVATRTRLNHSFAAVTVDDGDVRGFDLARTLDYVHQ